MSVPSEEAKDFPGALTTARVYFILLNILALVGLPRLFVRGQESGSFLGSYSLQWVILLGINCLLALLGLVLLVGLFTPISKRLMASGSAVLRRLVPMRLLNLGSFLLPWLAFVLLVLWRYEKHYQPFFSRVWLFWLVAGLGAVFLKAHWKKPLPYLSAILTAALLYGAAIKGLGFFPEISASPFSLGWSEGSRFFYASLPFAERLYGMDVPLSSMHPTRYFLQSLPFLFDSSSIWLHRAWQVFLWVSLSLLAGWTLARRFRLGWAVTLLASIWGYLFLLQGPVYYHLLVCTLLVFWGFKRERFWWSLGVVVVASAWAGISRVNWIPVPAMLAIALYLLEWPVCAAHSLIDYLWRPAVWGAAGLLAALGSQAAYVLVSGHEDVSIFGSSFTSDLLWYRLLPSPTYPIGVLPDILLVSAPLLLIMAVNWVGGKAQWHWLRLLGLVSMLVVLFAGGLVVSTKIGGGSNIHNMDAYLVLLMAVGASVAFGRFASETGQPQPLWRPWPVVMLLVLIPVIYNLNIGDPFVRRDMEQANYDLGKLNEIVQTYAQQGEVLFITQRQVQVFGLVPGVRLSPDYELMTLTEMAMANNRPYLDRFEADLRSHRFSLIIADLQHSYLKKPERSSFAEEHNAWVTNVSRPLLKYYQKQSFFDTQGIFLMVPKP